MRSRCFLALLFLPLGASAQRSDSLVHTDARTGLMWMVADFSALQGRFLLNWNECAVWARQMNAKAWAGYRDWRVPTIAEYRSINRNAADREQYHRRFRELDTACVWGNGPYAFWASNEKGPYNASYISFLDGFATSGDKNKQVASGDWEGIPFGFSLRLVRRAK